MRVEIVVAVGCISTLVFAGVADDFKDASNRDGCEAIPYSSERASCTSSGRDVDDWCKSSSRKWSCDDLDPTGINRNIDNVNAKISDLKKEKDDLEYRRNQTSDESERKEYEKKIDEKKAQVEDLQKKVESWTRQLADEKDMAGKRKEIGETCVKYRLAVQKIFSEVKSKVQSESDLDAKQYVPKLIEKYTSAEVGHQKAIDFTNRGIEKCGGMR
jgi:hypothetical protein